MEFDQYDCPNTFYIVHVDPSGDVDATCRLNPTNKPYMIAEHYPEFIENVPLPHSESVWEISRFCASEQARRESNGRITGQLIAAAIEFGLTQHITNYVALATDTVLPVIRRLAGWDPTPLGQRRATPDDFAYSVLYTVSHDMLESIRRKNNINGYLLFDVRPNPNPPTGGKMNETPIHVTRIDQQIRDDDSNQMDEMERTISYLEAMAFARDYKDILSGLRATRLILQLENYPSDETNTLKKQALDTLDNLSQTLKVYLGEKSDGEQS